MIGGNAYYLVYLYIQGSITIGDFSLIVGLSISLGHQMWFTMEQVGVLNQAMGKCKQSLSALMVESEVKDISGASDLVVTKGRIAFESVQFHYKGNDLIFEDTSVVIEAGQKVGLVGCSGGGKSTFVNLILRLYDVTAGCIQIDGQAIQEVTQESLRTNIAMIPQDPSLFHRSILDNIRYGNTDATDEAVIEAAKKAHAHAFISQLPQTYDSLVGERGVSLSGGQRQRIAIARAILKDAPILILDEATSQLDSVTENEIQSSLKELMLGKTTIVIAHRLSTLLSMDRILVFDQGNIIEDGPHIDLIRKEGLYKKLWEAQIGGFLLEDL